MGGYQPHINKEITLHDSGLMTDIAIRLADLSIIKWLSIRCKAEFEFYIKRAFLLIGQVLLLLPIFMILNRSLAHSL